jgi:hypothetical protein
MTILEWCQRLQDSEFGTALLASRYAFPLIETTHVLSLAFAVGLLAFIDLRLIGVFLRDRPVGPLLVVLRPWVFGGFAVLFVSGVLLFWSEAADMWVKPMFRVKLAVLVLAGFNALAFEWRFGRSAAEWGMRPLLPPGARFAGWASLCCWGIAILCGRWVAYGV